ncbi:hypothetical protein D3C81_222950 [compost metagenome]
MQESRTAIFYFSGTGNTEVVARLLSEALTREGGGADLFRIEDIIKGHRTPDYAGYGLIGIGHPVMGFGASSLVERFVRQLPSSSGTPVFVFKTASSPHYINYGASHVLLRSLRQKGYSPFHNSLLAMPCNLFMKYDDRLNKQLYEAARRKTEDIGNEIRGRMPRKLKMNLLLRVVLRSVYWGEGIAARFFAKGLSASSSCTLCMKCVRECPVSNIKKTEQGLSFGSDCMWCMRCIYNCPREAIQAKYIRSCVIRPYTGGPRLQGLAEDSGNDGRYVTKDSKGYYRHFIDYLEEE